VKRGGLEDEKNKGLWKVPESPWGSKRVKGLKIRQQRRKKKKRKNGEGHAKPHPATGPVR